MSGRYALLVGNSSYADQKLSQLSTPDADVEQLARLLETPELGNFDEVAMLRNESVTTVRKAIGGFFNRKRRDDLLLLYFSGHGVLDDQGHLYLALADTEVEFLRATAISSRFVTQEMDHSRSRRQILVLDCCHSGAFSRGTKGALGASVGTATAFEGAGYGRVVLTATDSTQYAWEGDDVVGEGQSSVFTRYLIEGLESGQADRDADGLVTLDELYDYVYEKVVAESPRQTPGKWSYKQQGEIVIARNPRPPLEPADLPADLKDAIDSPFTSVRFAAVTELDGLLRGRNRKLALAALEALREFADDDSRTVSRAAAEILDKREPEIEQLQLPVEPPVETSAEHEDETSPEPLVDAAAESEGETSAEPLVHTAAEPRPEATTEPRHETFVEPGVEKVPELAAETSTIPDSGTDGAAAGTRAAPPPDAEAGIRTPSGPAADGVTDAARDDATGAKEAVVGGQLGLAPLWDRLREPRVAIAAGVATIALLLGFWAFSGSEPGPDDPVAGQPGGSGAPTRSTAAGGIAPAGPAPTAQLRTDSVAIERGAKVRLSWQVTNAERVRLEPGPASLDPVGSLEVTPEADTTYTLVASGPGGEARDSVAIVVRAPAAAGVDTAEAGEQARTENPAPGPAVDTGAGAGDRQRGDEQPDLPADARDETGTDPAAVEEETPPISPPAGPLRSGDEVAMPVRTFGTGPSYPERAVRDQVEGEVVLDALIDTEGTVVSTEVVEGVHEDLDRAAVDAVSGWKYTPTMLDGAPVAVIHSVRVKFELQAWAIEVSSVSDIAEARTVAALLLNEGYPTFVTEADDRQGRPNYRVYVGRYEDEERAKSVAQALRGRSDLGVLVIVRR